MSDIIIIGAGTAGLSAAIYALRAGKSVLIFEGLSVGGQIINTPDVENYPGIAHTSGFEFANGLFEQAKSFGAELKREAVKEMVGRGVSYCATCDGMFYRGKDVAVAGGGNTALEDAQFLSGYCNHVYLIHRRDAFRGDQKNVSLLQARDNVEFVLNANVTALEGEKRVEGVTVADKFSGETRTLAVSGLFIAVGQMPANEAFANVVKLDDKGYIVADESCTTGTPGIFAAGDCRTKEVRQLTTAAADGAVAALAAGKYIDSLA